MRNSKKQLVTIVALIIVVIGLSIGFAAFSSTLNIQSGANVTPTGSLNVLFASQASTSDGNLIYQTNTGSYPVAITSTGYAHQISQQ